MLAEMRTHLWVLPRWFPLPVSTSAVVLGGVLAGANWFQLLIAAVIGAFLMAWSHTMNSWNDYYLTGFDRGGEGERSFRKPYTAGQNTIAEGYDGRKVAVNGAAFLWVGLGCAVFASFIFGTWLPIAVAAATSPLTFAYSYGKKYWLPETVLFVGFGPMAGLLGASMATSDPSLLLDAALATIPIGIMFGFAGEIFDQWWDAEPNWDRGLRSIGAAAWRYFVPVSAPVFTFATLGVVAHVFLIQGGVLSGGWWWLYAIALLSLAALAHAQERRTWAVMALLGGLSLYCILIPVVELL